MELTLEQKAAVGRWIKEGARLAEVQNRIHEEFGIELTYMEVRFLALDIGASPKDKPEPKIAEVPRQTAPQSIDEGQDDDSGKSGDEEAALPPDGLDAEEEAPQATGDALLGGKVTVALDKIVRAGAAMSGTVTFSDGVVGNWVLDAYGRLGITKISKPGYEPSQADITAFQRELQNKLSAGY